jgi:Tol biopolymer transport system component
MTASMAAVSLKVKLTGNPACFVCYQVGMVTTPFDDLDAYLALPRASGLAVSPDGSRVVTSIAELNEKRAEFVAAIWELDPDGTKPARRLTRGAKGESSPVFTADGDLLFLAARPTEGDDTPPASLWRLPAAGGEAVEALALPGGIDAVRTARAADVTAVATKLLRSASGIDDDKRLRALRKDNKVSAVLHNGYPVRYWDHDLGPDQPHLLDVDGARDLTPQPGDALREAAFDVSSDGTFIVTSWHDPAPGASIRAILVRIHVATGQRTAIADDPQADLGLPAISPDGTAVAFTRETHSTPDKAPRITLCHMPFGGPVVELTGEWDRWPTSVTWTVDGSAVLVTADQNGRGPVFAVDPSTRAVSQLTDDDYTYSDVHPAPDGVVYAMRSSYARPSHPVRIDTDGTVTELPCVAAP